MDTPSFTTYATPADALQKIVSVIVLVSLVSAGVLITGIVLAGTAVVGGIGTAIAVGLQKK